MDLKTLKKDFGKDISFWGWGIDTQKILPNASVEEIRDHVKETIDIMAPGADLCGFQCTISNPIFLQKKLMRHIRLYWIIENIEFNLISHNKIV